MLTLKQALEESRDLEQVSDSWRLDAELLLADAIESTREHLFTWPDQELSETQRSTFRSHHQRRQQGEPVAYILGRQAFWDFELQVNEHMLIPRPETELLVENAIELLSADDGIQNSVPRKIVDLGTGSGAIALALAKAGVEFGWQVLAVDKSADALVVAKKNAENLQLTNIEFSQASWCDGLEKNSCDMIIANPPYLAPDDVYLQQGDIRFEPQSALVADECGLADIRTIVLQAKDILKNESWLLLEHSYAQGEAVAEILESVGFVNIRCKVDLASLDRVTLAQYPNVLSET